MAKATLRTRRRATPKPNVIWLQDRFPGRFRGPPRDIAVWQRITAILNQAFIDSEGEHHAN